MCPRVGTKEGSGHVFQGQSSAHGDFLGVRPTHSILHSVNPSKAAVVPAEAPEKSAQAETSARGGMLRVSHPSDESGEPHSGGLSLGRVAASSQFRVIE